MSDPENSVISAGNTPQSDDFAAYTSSKKKLKLWWIVVPVILISIGLVTWLVWFSPVFAVKEVQVVDATGQALSLEQVSQVRDIASISINQPIARLDSDSAAQAIANLPWVSAVEVRRGWPNEVVVALELRVPLARVKEGDTNRGVDAEGVIFESNTLDGLPLIQASGAPLVSAVEVIAALPNKLAKKVVRVRAASIDSIELDLKSGSTVRWGSSDELEFKAAVLDALLSRRAQIYDVSAPELPTTTDEKGPKKR
ncbi:MAG: FtsQ-type POTRA domain-containing protein [Actinomycetia bacterium]|nr:FtsQ-type POTRA domain-containing protein [Actinomycetes bacterium]